MAIGDYSPAPKPNHKRNKPTRKERGEVTHKVRMKLWARCGGICEMCYQKEAVDPAHTLRRLDIKGSTTVEDLLAACRECHTKLDSTAWGKKFKEQFRYIKYKNAGRLNEYYL